MMTDPTGNALRANDLPYDASDPKQVKSAIKGSKDKGLRNKAALQNIMQTAEGRAWMHSLLERCRPFRSTFSTDPIQMAFNSGEANIGLQLIADLHAASTELYLVMMREQNV